MIFTIGGSDLIVEFLQVTALVAGSNWFSILLIGVILVSSAWVILVLAFFPARWAQFRLWFFTMLLFLSMMISTTMDIRVFDHLQWNNPGRDPSVIAPENVVEDVPLAIGVFATLTSIVGNAVTVAMESYSLDRQDTPGPIPRLTQDGYLFKLLILAELTTAQLTSRDAQSSFTSFLEKCYLGQLQSGQLLVEELEGQNDLWGYMQQVATGSPSEFNYYEDGQITQSYACNAIDPNDSTNLPLRDLNGLLAHDALSAQRALAFHIFGLLGHDFGAAALSQAQQTAVFERQVVSSYLFFTSATADDFIDINGDRVRGASARSLLLFQNQMLINHLQALAQAYDSSSQGQSVSLSGLDETVGNSLTGLFWVLNFKAVLHCLLFGFAPFVLLLLVTPVGFVVFRNFVFAMFWIESWAPLMVILNAILSEQARSEINARANIVSERLGEAYRHINLSTQTDIKLIAIETVQLGNLIAIILPFAFLLMMFGASKVAGIVGRNIVQPSGYRRGSIRHD